jgi:Putative phage tail protein
MSNIGQAVLTVVGTVVGAYFGNPELGFALGSLAGSELFPTQLPSGPKLTDNRTTTASLGEPTPIVFGTASVAGTVIDLGPIISSTVNNSQKGGPEQTTYQYNQTIAIGLGESPVDLETAIAGMLRVWENGSLVYDIRPQQAANSQTGQVAETDEEYAQRLEASATYAESFVLYLGSEDQEPDPSLEAIHGVGNVQAYLGLAYIVYPNRLLLTTQGWRHPNFQFEIYQSGTGDCTSVTEYSPSQLYPWDDKGPYEDPTNVLNLNTYNWIAADPNAPNYGSFPTGTFNTLSDAWDAMNPVYGYDVETFVVYGSLDYATLINNPQTHVSALAPGDPDAFTINDLPFTRSLQLHFNFKTVPEGRYQVGTGLICPPTGAFYQPGGYEFWGLAGIWITTNSATDPGVGSSQYLRTQSVNCLGTQPASNFALGAEDAILNVIRAENVPADPCTGLPPSPDPDYCVRGDGRWVKRGTWVLSPTITNGYLVLQKGKGVGPNRLYPSLTPALILGSPDDTEAMWTAAYNDAVTRGDMDAGYTYNALGTGTSTTYPVAMSQLYQIDQTVCTGSGAQAKVSDIIRAVCGRAGITNIDVTDMENIFVDGYPISSLSSAVDILNPLRSVAFFDAVESGLTIRFQSRGKDIVATLGLDDIGAYDAQNSGGNVPPSVSIVRSLDSDLPRRIRFHYNSVERDYQPGEQDSPFRPTSIAVNPQDISIPIAMGDTQALQAAEILWADAWNGRTAFTISVDQAWAQLEGGDCISIPVEGFTRRARIIKDQNSGGVLRQLTLVSDNAASYTSVAVAPPTNFNPPKIQLVCPTVAYFMDLPALQDADATAGFYVAVSRFWGSGNTWKGATIYKSTDGGVSYGSPLFSLATESTAGVIVGAIPVSEAWTWDPSTVIVVQLPDDSLSFESITDAAVLAGGNAAAVGDDGRWEVIQFATATKVDVGLWHLSRLLRGRRGTEHVIGTSRSGDRFVELVSGALMRVPLNISEIGNLDDYKALSIGATFSSAAVIPFTGRAVALMPFSPVHIRGIYQTDGDILLTWFRRNRIGRTLMSGVDIPNSDPPLTFQVVIEALTPDSPVSVIRTLTVSVHQAIYTAAQIFEDFGSTPPSHIRVSIYQMSTTVGRGYAGNAIINLFGDSAP